MTPHEEKFRAIVQYLIYRGVKPTPKVLNLCFGRDEPPYSRNLNMINGPEVKWRTDVLQQHGWKLRNVARGELAHERWMPPADWRELGSKEEVIQECRKSLS